MEGRGDDGSPRMPPGCSPVEEVSEQVSEQFCSNFAFHEAFAPPGKAKADRPIILRKAKVKEAKFYPRCEKGAYHGWTDFPVKNFKVAKLGEELGKVKLPHKSDRGAGGTGGLYVVDQNGKDVINGEECAWQPRSQSFSKITEDILKGDQRLYMRLGSANQTCRRTMGAPSTNRTGWNDDGSVWNFSLVDYAEHEDNTNGLLREFIQRAPMPYIAPYGTWFAMIFWMGSENKNFGLHTDLYTEQYILQTEGEKEFFAMLPENPACVDPMNFLTSEKHYKSSHRTVRQMDLTGTGCLWGVLREGDLLYLPPFWWHEFRTVSTGPSLSMTIRVHLLPQEKAYYSIVKHSRVLRQHLLERGDKRLLVHSSLIFIRGFLLGLPASRRHYAGVVRQMLESAEAESPRQRKGTRSAGQSPPSSPEAPQKAGAGVAPLDVSAKADVKADLQKEQELPLAPRKAPESDDGGSTTATRQISSESPPAEAESQPATPPPGVSEAQAPMLACKEQGTQTEPQQYRVVLGSPNGPGAALFAAASAPHPSGASLLASDLVMVAMLAGASMGFIMGLCAGRRLPR